MALIFRIYGDSKPPVNNGIGAGFEEVVTAIDGQTIVTFGGRYRPGTRELQVYLNGVRQIIDVDYVEIDVHTIEFIEPLEEHDKVFVTVSEVTNQTLFQQFIAGDGQLSYVLSKPYQIGAHGLQVHENGQLLSVNEDYIEEDEYTITFKVAPAAGARITIREVL